MREPPSGFWGLIQHDEDLVQVLQDGGLGLARRDGLDDRMHRSEEVEQEQLVLPPRLKKLVRNAFDPPSETRGAEVLWNA